MNYEQKYKEALEWMRSVYDGLHGATKEDAEHYFPELKESEYERMKFLIKSCVYAADITPEGREEIFAWLEKQGDNKKLDADKVIEWLKNTIREMKEYFGEHDMFYNTRLTLPYNSIEDLINDFREDFGL